MMMILGGSMMSFKDSQGVPLAAAIIVLVAVVILGGISFGFQGAIHLG